MAPFLWNDEEQFIALVNLLSLRNGGQLDAGSGEDDVLNHSDEVDIDDGDTVHPHLMSGVDDDCLKRKVLDRMAEVASRDKGGRQVSCAILQEKDDAITIYLSRNEGFDKTDKDFFKKTEKLLAAICTQTNEDAQPAQDALWKRMLQYNEPRLEQYVRSLRENLRSFRGRDSGTIPSWSVTLEHDGDVVDDNQLGPYTEQTHESYMAFARKKLDELSDIVESPNKRTPADTRRLLVEKSHSMRHLSSVKIFIKACSSTSLANKLLSDILFLGRLRSAYLTFIDAAHNIAAFTSTSIVLVVAPKPRAPPLRPHPLADVFKGLALPYDDASIRKHVHPKFTLPMLQEKYAKLLEKAAKLKLPTHAEVQLIVHLLKLGIVDAEVFPYIGCSKLTCFLCSSFLRSRAGPKFKTRGCHGKLYTLWSVPDTEDLTESAATVLSSSLAAMRSILISEILKPIQARVHVAESSAGYTAQNSVQTRYLHMLQERRAREAEFNFLRQNWSSAISKDGLPTEQMEDEEDEEDNNPDQRTAVEAPIFGECEQCETETSRKCSKCNRPWLCSENCERLYDSPYHNFLCAIDRPLDSADYLYLACLKDTFPDDSDTLNDYGFSRLLSVGDQSKLLGLYRGVFLYMNTNVRDLHKWQLEGTLAANIIAMYEKIPEGSRGGYYPWFLQNRHIVDSTSAEIDPHEMQNTFFAIARPYLDPADKDKAVQEFTPQAKRDSFMLYALLLRGWHPDPVSLPDLFFDFGFCTCRETPLAFLYLDLIKRCTFTEFWKAHQSNSLIPLFDAYGLAQHRKRMPHLEAFLAVGSNVNDFRPSVWNLVLFLNTEGADAPRYLLVDYGFLNCDNAKEKLDLKEVYTRLLKKVDPMDLHNACITGRLYDFASRHTPLSHRFQRLMRNPYPLPGCSFAGMCAANVSIKMEGLHIVTAP
ncbi:hypothetical protein BKA93DRAFT_893568 [Sparassis latifolia]